MIISVPGRTFLNKVTCLCLLLYLSELSSMGLHSEKKAFQWNNGTFNLVPRNGNFVQSVQKLWNTSRGKVSI